MDARSGASRSKDAKQHAIEIWGLSQVLESAGVASPPLRFSKPSPPPEINTETAISPLPPRGGAVGRMWVMKNEGSPSVRGEVPGSPDRTGTRGLPAGGRGWRAGSLQREPVQFGPVM